MQNFQEIFETPKWSSISAFSICMTVPLRFEFADHSNGLPLLYFARFPKTSMFLCQKYQNHTRDQKKAKFLKMINKHIIFKFFIEFINHEKKTNRAVLFSYRCLPNILNYCDRRWNFPNSGDQDSFRHKLKNSANIYMKVEVHCSSELPLEHTDNGKPLINQSWLWP